jgi:hypothetical protein
VTHWQPLPEADRQLPVHAVSSAEHCINTFAIIQRRHTLVVTGTICNLPDAIWNNDCSCCRNGNGVDVALGMDTATEYLVSTATGATALLSPVASWLLVIGLE